MKVTITCLRVFLILGNLCFLSGSDSRNMVKRIFLAAETATMYGNSFPYDFAASAVLLKLEEEIGILFTNVALCTLNQDTEHTLNM